MKLLRSLGVGLIVVSFDKSIMSRHVTVLRVKALAVAARRGLDIEDLVFNRDVL